MRTLKRTPLIRVVNGRQVCVIPLTQLREAIVDVQFLTTVSKHNWHAVRKGEKFWARTYVNDGNGNWKRLMLSDLVKGPPSVGYIWDHIDRNGLNNRLENLRLATRSQNRQNCSSSKYHRGITFCNRTKAWIAQIQFQNRNHFLGYHETPQRAARAYDEGAKQFFGEFAALNFP